MDPDENVDELLLMLLREGSTGHAIELYRDETGASRTEARRYVNGLASQHGLRSSMPWLPFSLLGGSWPAISGRD